MRPDEETNNAFVYCLGYAAEKTGVEVVAFVANSNHYHAVVIDRMGRLPEFTERFHRLFAKHQNVLRRRRENFWSSEQTSMVELVDPDDVLAKVVYTLTNPAKDHLVERANDWPGAISLEGTLGGRLTTAKRPGRFFRAKGPTSEQVKFECVRAPGYEGLTAGEYSSMLKAAIETVESQAAAERALTGRRVLGRRAILSQEPEDQPTSTEPRRTLNPTVAARDKQPRAEALERRKEFQFAYAESRGGWATGIKVEFPVGTWWLRRHAGVTCVGDPAAKAGAAAA